MQHEPGSSFNVKYVISHLPGRNASLSRVYASHSVPEKTSTNCSGENLAITIEQRQRS